MQMIKAIMPREDKFFDLFQSHCDLLVRCSDTLGRLFTGADVQATCDEIHRLEKQADDVSQFGAKTPMKRPAQPEEIAPAYVFLASPQCSSYITGEILPVIGGY